MTSTGALGGRPKEKVKLLVPINFSPKSDLALDFALTINQNLNADVYLFHVFEGSTTNYRRLDRLNEEYLERMRQVLTQAVERLHSKGIHHSVEDVYRRISNGRPWVEILRMAAGISSDMIIMGTPNSRDMKKLVGKENLPCTLILVCEKDPSFVMP